MSLKETINYEYIMNDNNSNSEESRKQLLLSFANKREFIISFLPQKIISEKLFCKHFLFLRRIIVLESPEIDSFIPKNPKFDEYLKKEFNVNDFEYNQENIVAFINTFKSSFEQCHEITINDLNNKNDNPITIYNFWFYVILEQILFQILIPSMNEIADLLTINYYIYENQEKLRKIRYIAFLLKDYHELHKKKEKIFKLKSQIELEVEFLHKKLEILKTSSDQKQTQIQKEKEKQKENENVSLVNIDNSPLVYLFEFIIKGKKQWYDSLQKVKKIELLIEFNGVTKTENIYLNLICFLFLANRIVNSPLNPRREKVLISYEFNISHAFLKDINLQQVITQLQYEKHIHTVKLKENTFDFFGMYELAIVCFLNNHIQYIDLTKCQIKKENLEGFNRGLEDIQNFIDETNFINITKLNLTNNLCSGKLLSRIVEKLPQLKTLILNQNDEEKIIREQGNSDLFANVFNTLEKLYRNHSSNLESLFLVKCKLKEDSLYELGKLLASYHCKLKRLAINESTLNNFMGIKLLKKLKYNRSLEELYLNKTDLYDAFESHILKIISNTFIKILYLHGNYFSPKNIIKIIARTQIEEKEKLKMNPTIMNIDLSEQSNQNTSQIREGNANKKEKFRVIEYSRRQIDVIEKVLINSELKLLDITGLHNSIIKEKKKDKLKKTISTLFKDGTIIFC